MAKKEQKTLFFSSHFLKGVELAQTPLLENFHTFFFEGFPTVDIYLQ